MGYTDPRAQQQPGAVRKPTTPVADPRANQPGGVPVPPTPVADSRANQPTAGGTPSVPPVPAFTQVTDVPKFSGPWVPPVPEPTAPNPVGPAAPNGFDMSMPGATEMQWDATKDKWNSSPTLDWAQQQLPQFQDPWAGENQISQSMGQPVSMQGAQYWNGVQGKGNTEVENQMAAGYQGGNNALSAFNQTQSALPGSLQPQFDAYYDRMAQKNMSNVNSQAAARGAYGSNTALNGAIGAGLDAEAQRAKAATDFSLQDSANQRNWMDTLGTQARNADQTGLDAFGANQKAAQFGLDKTKTMSDIAFGVDDRQLDRDKFGLDQARTLDELKGKRLDSGISTAFGVDQGWTGRLAGAQNASSTAQRAREGRIGQLYNDQVGMSNDVQSFLKDNYDAILGGDTAMSDNELQTMIAQQADQRGWDQQTQERIFRDAKATADLITGKKNAAAAGGGTG